MFTDPVGTTLPVRLLQTRVPSCLPQRPLVDIDIDQIAKNNTSCELRTSRRATTSRHSLPPTTIGRRRHRRPGRLRPGAQPSLFTRAKCEPRTLFRVISSSTVDAFTSGLTHEREPPSWRRHLGIAILTTPCGCRHLSAAMCSRPSWCGHLGCDVTSVSTIDM
jgi:hypothetical protein